MISGAGETTCGNTRCSLHPPRNIDAEEPLPGLTTLELPFSYVEHGENKMALVKVVLCGKCCKKLMWKRNKEKERQQELAAAAVDASEAERAEGTTVKQEVSEQVASIWNVTYVSLL